MDGIEKRLGVRFNGSYSTIGINHGRQNLQGFIGDDDWTCEEHDPFLSFKPSESEAGQGWWHFGSSYHVDAQAKGFRELGYSVYTDTVSTLAFQRPAL